MLARNRNIEFIFTLVAVAVFSASLVHAQSAPKSFGSTIANEFKTQNSSSWHSANNVRTRLNENSVSLNRFAPRNPPKRSPQAQKPSKPFSSISRGPTVSPYLALSNPRGQVSDYFNIIKPQREQQRLNRQQQRTNQQLQRQNLANLHRLNEMAAEGPYDTRGSERMAPTGHTSFRQEYLGSYFNTGGYFPPPSEPKSE